MLRKLRARIYALTRSSVVRRVRKRRLTYLDDRALSELEQTMRALDVKRVPGIIVEAGCALGGSAVVLGSSKRADRSFRIYDVFGMIPPPTAADDEDVHARYQKVASGKSDGIEGDPYYGYEKDLRTKVTNTLRSFGLELAADHIELIQGLFKETMKIEEPVALAHIDADWYDSVMTCLEHIAPQLSPGGELIIDDYAHWSGCRKAVDAYFADKSADYVFSHRARLHITRIDRRAEAGKEARAR